MRFCRLIMAPALLLLLPGCYYSSDTRNEAERRVDEQYTCESLGYIQPFSTEYQDCVLSEQAARAFGS